MEVAFAERQAELTKMEKYDATCGKKVTWSESLLDWWKSSATFQNDPCEEYFKALMINPVLLVPPTKALAVTFTNFITEPLKHVGKGIGEFFHALLAEMPVLYQLPVLIVIALLLLVFCYGAGTSVHHIGLLRRNHDAYRERLPPPETQNPAYNRYIEAGDRRIYHSVQPNQPHYIEGQREPSNPRPENLSDMDRGDFRNQQERNYQAKEVVFENRAHEQNELKEVPVMVSPFGQERSKEDPVNRPLTNKSAKELPEERSPGSQVQQEEPLKDHEHFEKSPVHKRHFLGSPTPLLVTSVGPIENMNLSPAKAKEETSSCNADLGIVNGKQEELRHQETTNECTGSSAAPPSTFAVHDNAQEVGKNSFIDLYTDLGIEEQSESFVVLEDQE